MKKKIRGVRTQNGFTLVELAIVITIICLLIGGVLKGQELLENARMTSSVAQVKSIATAAITFRDVYKALPGDMAQPANFLQNCTVASPATRPATPMARSFPPFRWGAN